MKTIQAYISAFLLASCMLNSVPNYAMDSNNNNVANSIFTNHYISASVFVGVLFGSYLCYKHFFGNKVTASKPNVKQKTTKQIVASPKVSDSSMEEVKPVIVARTPVNQIIKVMNSNDQSLNISISDNNTGCMQQFVVPSYSYDVRFIS